MIPKECKRLAEVDFPIAVVSKHSAREKSIRHGHPSTLHLWWARRPLATCRAMLLALLLPDPCDEHCPGDFKEKARQLLLKTEPSVGQTNKDLRKALLDFIGDFSNWDNASEPKYLDVGRGLVKAAHPEETPLVVDPFAGGGSIPLEALRLGCDAFASDLNPVACLILKVMLEDIPCHGLELAAELRRVGAEIRKRAEEELAEFYPLDPDGSRPIAYLWARTVRCEAPNCGAEIPLIRSFWLSKRARRKWAVRVTGVKNTDHGLEPQLDVFQPSSHEDVRSGTVSGAMATCLHCGSVLPPERVRAQLSAQRGGSNVLFDDQGNRCGGARLFAVVSVHQGESGRYYRAATPDDYHRVYLATRKSKECPQQSSNMSLDTTHELLPSARLKGASGFRVLLYGMRTWRDLYTDRQALSLSLFCDLVRQSFSASPPVAQMLALNLGRLADYSTALCSWKNTTEKLNHTFGRHAIPMMWDFAEVSPISETAGNLSWIARVAEVAGDAIQKSAQTQMADAIEHPLPDLSSSIWFTDPPYYDAIAYADLSDFFFVWLKLALPNHPCLQDRFDPGNSLTPKERECIQDSGRTGPHGESKGPGFFERTVAKAFAEGRRTLREDGVGCIVFAHKTTEGWEALLSGIISSGWTVTASWPITTEMGTRLNAHQNASLSASIHLICRPRPSDATIGDWGEILRELPKRVGLWMERLQSECVRGADLVFACIGPALEIYSQYSRVEDAAGCEIPLGGNPEAADPHERGFLAYVWETVGRVALEQVLGTAEAKARNGAAGAVEEDARLTALFLWTLQSTNGKTGDGNQAPEDAEEEVDEPDEDEEETTSGKKTKGFTLVYDVARRFAQPLGIHLPDWEGRILETKKGVVRLLAVSERAKQLFGDAGASAVADRLEEQREVSPQMLLFPEMQQTAAPKIKARRKKADATVSDDDLQGHRGATTLDRVHAAMLLQASGRSNALRALIKAEQQRGPDSGQSHLNSASAAWISYSSQRKEEK